MTDTASLPYVDLSADPAELIKYAKDHFGVRIASNASPDTVVARFAEIYKDETGTILDPVQDVEEDDFDEEPTTAKAKQPTHVTINIHPDENDPHPVCLGANFRAYRIVRNEDVKVPFAAYNSLRDAVSIKRDPKTLDQKRVQTYPFSVVEMHY